MSHNLPPVIAPGSWRVTRRLLLHRQALQALFLWHPARRATASDAQSSVGLKEWVSRSGDLIQYLSQQVGLGLFFGTLLRKCCLKKRNQKSKNGEHWRVKDFRLFDTYSVDIFLWLGGFQPKCWR